MNQNHLSVDEGEIRKFFSLDRRRNLEGRSRVCNKGRKTERKTTTEVGVGKRYTKMSGFAWDKQDLFSREEEGGKEEERCKPRHARSLDIEIRCRR